MSSQSFWSIIVWYMISKNPARAEFTKGHIQAVAEVNKEIKRKFLFPKEEFLFNLPLILLQISLLIKKEGFESDSTFLNKEESMGISAKVSFTKRNSTIHSNTFGDD